MSQWATIFFLYAVGSIVLIVELFIPAHGLIGLVGVGILGYGLYETFQISHGAGLIGLAVLVVTLPTGVIVAVRNWHRTPVGRRISPPNPKLTAADRMPVEETQPLIGQTGRALTALRPVGTCSFDGRRVECKAEHGMIEKGAEVEGVDLADRTLVVRSIRRPGDAAQA